MTRRRNTRRRNTRRPRRMMRRRNMAGPARPPPINVDPWFHVTLSFEDKQNGVLNCFSVDAIYKALDNQLDMSRSGKYYVLQVHRVRVWNLSGGPIYFEPCQLVDKHDCTSVALPLTSIEEYAGRNSWARIQYAWPRTQARLLQDDNSNTGIVFLRKGRKDDLFIIHLHVSFKVSTPNSFSGRSVVIRDPVVLGRGDPIGTAVDLPGVKEAIPESLGFEEITIDVPVARVLRSSARRRV